MTARERTLAIFFLPLLLLAGGGLLAHQFWYEPLRSRDTRIANLLQEIKERQNNIDQILQKKREYAKYAKVSLPADADLGRREYEEQLSKTLRQSGFEPNGFSVTPKPVDTKTSPTQINKKPIYSRLIFTVTAKGDLRTVVDFLERFYQLPLLHKINNIAMRRPLSGTNRNNELDMDLTIEAIVLDNAEPRKTLLAEPKPDLPPLLAGAPRKYPSIAGKNIFFGPPAPVATPTPTVRKSSTNYAEHIKFVSLTEGEKGWEASFYDSINAQEYFIRPRAASDGFDVEVSYILGGRRRSLRSGRAIEVMDENGELQHRWMVVKFGDRDLYLRDENNFFALHLGQRLSEMTKLTAEEVQSLGLNAKPK